MLVNGYPGLFAQTVLAIYIYIDLTQVSRRSISSDTRLCQQLVWANCSENMKDLYRWSFVRRIHR